MRLPTPFRNVLLDMGFERVVAQRDAALRDAAVERAERDNALRQVRHLRDALDFYANPSKWEESGDTNDPRSHWASGVIEAELDKGAVARAALAGREEPE